MSGSGISWAMCKSAPRSRHITMPTPHHSVFYRLDALPATQLCQCTEGKSNRCKVMQNIQQGSWSNWLFHTCHSSVVWNFFWSSWLNAMATSVLSIIKCSVFHFVILIEDGTSLLYFCVAGMLAVFVFFCSTVLFCMVYVTFVGFSSLCYCNLSGGCGEINRWTRYAVSLSHAHDWGRISMVPYKILLLLFSVYLLAACLQSVKRNLVRQSFLAVFFPNNLSFKHLLYVHIYLKLPHFILLSLTFTEWCLRKKLSLKRFWNT